MSDDRLFDVPDIEPVEKVSSGRRLTARNNDMIERGIHPVTRGPIDARKTCGECKHLYTTGERHRRYFKCGLVDHTFGPGTDIRKSWPSCEKFEEFWGKR